MVFVALTGLSPSLLDCQDSFMCERNRQTLQEGISLPKGMSCLFFMIRYFVGLARRAHLTFRHLSQTVSGTSRPCGRGGRIESSSEDEKKPVHSSEEFVSSSEELIVARLGETQRWKPVCAVLNINKFGRRVACLVIFVESCGLADSSYFIQHCRPELLALEHAECGSTSATCAVIGHQHP